VKQNVSQTIAPNLTADLMQSGETLQKETLIFDINNPNYKNVWGQHNFEKLPDGSIKVVFPA
jgi:hypothetical protein